MVLAQHLLFVPYSLWVIVAKRWEISPQLLLQTRALQLVMIWGTHILLIVEIFLAS